MAGILSFSEPDRYDLPAFSWTAASLGKSRMSFFKIIGTIEAIEEIASGRAIRSLRRLRRTYGGKNWRKMKGNAHVRLKNGTELDAEVHWYYAHGVGKKEFKIKRFLP